MRSLHITVSTLLALAALGSAASAQTRQFRYRGAVYAGVGQGRFSDDEGSLGSGASFTGGLEVRPSSRLGFELDVTHYRHERAVPGSTTFSGDGTILMGSLAYHFSQAQVQTFVRAGVGLLRSERESRFPTERADEVFSYGDTELAAGVGAGVKIFMTSKLSLRPEVGFVFSGKSYLNRIAASLAVSYHW